MRLPAQGCRVRRSGGVLIHVVPHRVGPGPAATSADGRRRLLLPAATAIGFAAGELLVARLVPATQLGLAGPVLLLAAVLCLLAEDRLVRPAHPLNSRRATATTGGRRGSAGQAVAGPCDGQQLAWPAGCPVPAEFWLAAEGAAGEEPLHRYLLPRPPANPPHHQYAPPTH